MGLLKIWIEIKKEMTCNAILQIKREKTISASRAKNREERWSLGDIFASAVETGERLLSSFKSIGGK